MAVDPRDQLTSNHYLAARNPRPTPDVNSITAAVREQLSLLTIDQVAEMLQVAKSWVYDEVEAGKFPVKRLGRQLRFRPADLEAYLDGRWEAPTATVLPMRPRVGRPRSPRIDL